MLLRLYPEHVDVLIILLPTLVFSLCLHEFSHGYIAYMLGDKTAARNGRLTLNPMAHLDPIGSLMILFVGFGWAKPVPVNPINFANPRIDMMKVAFAGPASNLILAFIAGTILRFTGYAGLFHNSILIDVLQYLTWINIALAVFNMIPLSPLDGSQIFGNMIAKNYPEIAWKLQIHGPKVLMFLLVVSFVMPQLSIFRLIMTPFINIFMYLFAGL